MATLLLTAVGTAVGGPIGGALGALAGQAFDAKLLKPKGGEGPRLTELAVQTSSYGTPIPKLFGTMRVAGTVIWSTDLIEHATREGGGKGRSGTTRYSYSASFAVLLSARSIRSVGRIWADGALLRGVGGDFKTATRFRLYLGDEAQDADPLIASAEGAGLASACRGQAYAVFEDFALAEFGNRIPSLTFEVVADDGPVTCGAIAEDVSRGAIRGGEAATVLHGYSAYGETIRSVTDGLLLASGAWVGSDLTLRVGAGEAVELGDDGAGDGRRASRSIAAADTAPRVVTVQHYDPARDYQAGLQRAARTGAGLRELRIELPAAIPADAAKTLAGAALTRADIARERRTLSLDWRAAHVAPGDRVTMAGEAGVWRVVDWSLEAMVLTLDLARIARAPVAATATAGRIVAALDAAAGMTILHMFEIPPIDETPVSRPQLTIAAAGTGAGWRGADLQLSLDGATWTPAGRTAGPAILGRLVEPPGAGPSTLVDRRNTVEVMLARPDMVLHDADDAALDRGANLAMVGDELLQFGRAEATGGGRWRLSELWRGRRGTEWAAGAATPGDRFVLLEPARLAVVPVSVEAVGTTVSAMAAGVGDGDTPVVARAVMQGASVAPPAPVHIVTEPQPDGAIEVRWTRRSRAGRAWIDRIDAPLIEEGERYELTVGGTTRMLTTCEVRLASGEWQRGDKIAIRQIGTHARSPAVRTTL